MSSERKVESIYTNNPEQEIWNYLADFEVETVVIEYLSRNRTDFTNDNNFNDEHNMIKDLLVDITNNAKQAREFFMLSKQLPLSSRPVLLHYAFEKLIIMFIYLKFGSNNSIKEHISQHGLTYFEQIEVKEKGLFVKLHEYFSPQNKLKGEKFDFFDLIDINAISYIKLDYNLLMKKELKITTVNTQKIISLKELEREFIFSFVLSVLSRYQISKWIEILSGKRDKSIIKIRRYFESIQLLFPNLILNELYDKTLTFYYPASLGDIEMENYDVPLELNGKSSF
jgi:YaaC-like Protein